MSSDVLLEELEVLTSIYPTEIKNLSESDIQIDAEPDYPPENADPLKVALTVHYPKSYPDVLPTLSLVALDGILTDEETQQLIQELEEVGNENLGMAMTFTLVSHLRERLSSLVTDREERRIKNEVEMERLRISG
jgi:hypothetical protein